MRKMKKIFAVLLTLAMVLGMSMTTMAAETTATITVNGVENANSVKMLQIIKPNPTTRTGWEFTNGAGEFYKAAFAPETDEQMIIASLIKYTNPNAKFTDKALEEAPVATAAQIDNALSKVANGLPFGEFTTTDGKTTSVSEAGVYAITAEEEGYTYKTMAAYVGFGVAPALENAEPITAKKAPTTITKTNTDGDKAVAIGDVVEFTVKTNFPYIDPNATTKSFTITDTLTGADFDLENDVLKDAIVKVGDDIVNLVAGLQPDGNFTVNGRSFTLDLSDYIDAANSNAGKEVTITYTATVKEVDVNNKVHSSTHPEYVVDYVYTGTIIFTKYAEDGTTTLTGAGFEVLKDGQVLHFTKDVDSATNEVIPGKYTYNPAGDVTEVFVDGNGVVEVKGLDKGTYHFAEKTAPEGYSINAEGKDVTLTYAGDTATATFEVTDSMNDTKLSSLPSTGGIGTTIFTIGGCLIMIIAAALFFSSRKKSAK